jgi:hypothetical protein
MAIELPDKCPHEAFDNNGQCVPGYVYVAQVGDIHKIGFTTNKVNRRMNGITCDRKAKAVAKIVFRSHCALSLEKDLHRAFVGKRIVRLKDQTDYFNLDSEDLAAIEQMTIYGGKELERVAATTEAVSRAAESQVIYFLCPDDHEIRIDAGNPINRGFNTRLLLEVAAQQGVHCPDCKQLVIPYRYHLGRR